MKESGAALRQKSKGKKGPLFLYLSHNGEGMRASLFYCDFTSEQQKEGFRHFLKRLPEREMEAAELEISVISLNRIPYPTVR